MRLSRRGVAVGVSLLLFVSASWLVYDAVSSHLRQKDLRLLQARCGVQFPAGTFMLRQELFGINRFEPNRDSFAIVATSPVAFPAIHATGMNGYIDLPLDLGMRIVEKRMPGRIGNDVPTAAFSTEWKFGVYSFEARWVAGQRMQYIIIDQTK